MKAIACFTLGILFVALLTGLFLAESTIAKAGVLTCLVPGDYATIQAAVDDPACAEIELGNQVFKENVTISRTVNIQGRGPANTVVDGAGIGNVFTIILSSEIRKPEPITVTLNGLAITNGQTGVFIDLNGDIQREESTIYVNLKNCLISDNAGSGIEQAPKSGKTETHVDTCTVSGNSSLGILNAPGWSSGYGDLTVVNSSINNNSGVGISNKGCPRGGCRSAVRLLRSTVSGNLDSGVFVGAGAATQYGTGSYFNIINSTISGNTAVKGGGIYSCDLLYLINSTVSNNSAGSGGGIYIHGATHNYGCSGRVLAANSIVANNIIGGDCVLSEGEVGTGIFWDLGNNIFEDGTCISSETSSSGDPLLGPLANNGGPTLTHALAPDSPAIDAGDNARCPDTDQRGYPRPLDGDKNGTVECDIGSYEYDHFDYTLTLPMVTH